MAAETGAERAGHRGRVLLVADSLVGGGAERHVSDLALGLRERGWDVALACSCTRPQPGPGPRALGALENQGVPVLELGGRLVKRRLSVPYAVRLRRAVRDGEFDVVHAHIYASEVAAALATVGTRTALVVTEHTEAPWRGPFARLASRLVYRRAGAVLVVSQAIAELMTQSYGVPADRVALVLPVGPDAGGVDHAAGQASRPTEGFVGRLQPEKVVDVLLDAMVLVRQEVPDARLIVAGSGPEQRPLQERAEALGLERAVSFLGFRSDVPAVLREAHVLAVPSRSDGSPLVVHEAMTAGVPVVGSRVGGIVDRLQDGAAGLLVPPEDPLRLAEALVRLLKDDDERGRLAQVGRRAASALRYADMVDQVQAVYLSLIADVSPAASARD